MSAPIDRIGHKFNMLTVVGKGPDRFIGPSRLRITTWRCRCDCGNETTVSVTHLKRKLSCGCTRLGSKSRKWTGCGEISGKYWGSFTGPVRRQRKNGSIQLNMTIEDAWSIFLKQNRRCALSGLELMFGVGQTASLDRIDSDGHYSIDNVQWIHKDINTMKMDFDQRHFINMCKTIAEYRANG